MNTLLPLALLALGTAAPVLADPSPAQELSLGYSYVHTNAPPDHCGCFSMNGASAAYQFRLSDSIGIVGDLGVEHAGNVRSSGLDLTLTSVLGGARYTDSHVAAGRVALFGQALVGVTRASGGLAAIAPGAHGASTDFSALVGAGIDIQVSPRLSLRALELDYFLTRLPNGVNGYQNNLRASIGLVFHFGAATAGQRLSAKR